MKREHTLEKKRLLKSTHKVGGRERERERKYRLGPESGPTTFLSYARGSFISDEHVSVMSLLLSDRLYTYSNSILGQAEVFL